MADTKISAESAAATLDGTELTIGVQSAANVKITMAQIVNLAKLQKLSVFAATSSAELAGVISDETGSGALVFATSPTLVTPILGVAAATSVNKVAITAPAASATLTIANTKTLTVSNTLTLAGTDSTTLTFPSTSATIARTDAAQTFTGQQTDQDVTTTSPGWYAQVTGDAVPRFRSGLNATDVPSIAFGDGTNPRDLFLERSAAATLRFGAADAAAPVAQTLLVQSVVAGTSNTAGANLTIAGSKGTGTGAGGSIIFQVAPVGSTGSTQNALSAALTITSAKVANFGGPINAAAGDITATSGNVFCQSAGGFFIGTRGGIAATADGIFRIFNNAQSDVGRLNFGGTTSSFPAIKRSTTILQARLADDSAFASFQGKLTTDTAATTGLTAGVLSATTNASIVLYDSGGQAYRVPCII